MNLNQMWKKLAEYQPYAERRGFGEAWKRMTTERTAKAAADASWAARGEAADAAWAAVSAAAWSAVIAAERAVAKITKAIELENKA